MRRNWDRARVIAILSALRDDGLSVEQMRKMAGVNRSTIYRWLGQGGIDAPQPDRVSVQALAWAVMARYPDQARELVRAAGHPWEDAPEGEPEPLVDPEVAEMLRRRYPGEADELIAELERRITGSRGGQEAS